MTFTRIYEKQLIFYLFAVYQSDPRLPQIIRSVDSLLSRHMADESHLRFLISSYAYVCKCHFQGRLFDFFTQRCSQTHRSFSCNCLLAPSHSLLMEICLKTQTHPKCVYVHLSRCESVLPAYIVCSLFALDKGTSHQLRFPLLDEIFCWTKCMKIIKRFNGTKVCELLSHSRCELKF